jgi:HSP20 family protein
MRYGLSRLMNDGFGNPLASLRRMEQELDTLFGSLASGPAGFPPVNVQKSDTEVKVTAEVPGFEAKDLDIAVDGQVLTLSGTRQEAKEGQEDGWLVRERRSGGFSRAIPLPYGVDADAVKAEVKQGVLTVTLPRHEAEKPRKITVASEA